jgi:hypothetical protein
MILTAVGVVVVLMLGVVAEVVIRSIRRVRAKRVMWARAAAAVAGKTEEEVVVIARKLIENVSAQFGRALTSEECRLILGPAHGAWSKALHRSASTHSWPDDDGDASTTAKS